MRRSIGGMVVALLWGCAHSNQVTWKVESREAMHDTLAERIPPGTPLPTAQAFMEQEGFRCSLKRQGVFIERTWFGSKEPRHEDLDFLYCRRTQNAGHPLMACIWEVAVVVEDDTVQNLLVSRYVDGP